MKTQSPPVGLSGWTGGYRTPLWPECRTLPWPTPILVACLVAVLLAALAPASLATSGPADLPAAEKVWAQLARGDAAGAEAAARRILADGMSARVAFCLASALGEQGRGEETLTLFQEYDPSGTGPLALGVAAGFLDRPPEAENLLKRALEVFLERGDPEGALVVREQLGVLLIHLNRPQDAVRQLTASLAAADSLQLPLAAAFSHLHLGRALVRTREIDLSAEHLRAALAAAQELDVPNWQGIAAIALSVISRFRMDLDEALAYRQTALDAFSAAGNEAGQARSLHYIATIHIFRGELTTAMTMLRRALAMARRAEDAGVESGCLGELAAVDFLVGNFDRALAQYQEASRLSDDPRRTWYLKLNLGLILAFQGEHNAALARYQEAHEILREIGDRRNEAEILKTIGQSLCGLEEFERGLQQLDQATTLAREWSMPMTEAYALLFKGDCELEQGNLDAALQSLTAASELARQIGYFDIIESALLGRAQVARQRGAGGEALEFLTEALEVIATTRRRSGGAPSIQSGYIGQANDSFAELVDLLYEMHQQDPGAGFDRRAFDTAQLAKARSFLDLLAETAVDLRCRADETYQRREADILTRIAALDRRRHTAPADSIPILETEISSLENELELLEAELRQADPRYAELRYPRPCDLEQTQQEVLADGEALLEFFLARNASFVWVISRSDFRFVRLPGRKQIEEQVRAFLPLLGDYNVLGPDPTYYVAAASELYRSVLEPVAGQLAGAQRLILAPDGILHYLPFEALLLGEVDLSERRDFSSLPFLVLGKDVSYVPSVSALARLRATQTGSPAPAADLLLVGDPVLAGPQATSIFAEVAGAVGQAPLPFAAGEMEGIHGQIGGGGVSRLQQESATVARLREAAASGPYRFVHFATHGLFNEKRPQYSGLVLSPDPAAGDDGFLTVTEIFGLDLDCEQVVLSACSSALGHQVTGEGLVGLTRGFMYAGARSVVAALWDVAGETTARFMQDFYGTLAGGAGRARALAEAKRRLIRAGSEIPGADVALAHPYFWAPFVLNGDCD